MLHRVALSSGRCALAADGGERRNPASPAWSAAAFLRVGVGPPRGSPETLKNTPTAPQITWLLLRPGLGLKPQRHPLVFQRGVAGATAQQISRVSVMEAKFKNQHSHNRHSTMNQWAKGADGLCMMHIYWVIIRASSGLCVLAFSLYYL